MIALVASVIWNFTLNREFTFKASNNVPIAMAKVALFYAVFTPVSTIIGNYLAEALGWNDITLLNMLCNFILEFLYDKYVVFKGSIDSKEKKSCAKKDRPLWFKIWNHFCLVNKHRWLVFKLSIKAGIPWRGFVHDLSKYSPTEFLESAKYFNGVRSPITFCRADKGYSLAWLHHKGRNKHHLEYWEDMNRETKIPVMMPYKYAVEAVCDKIAAGMAYRGKEWTKEQPLDYWINVEKNFPVVKHPCTVYFIETVLKKIADEGLNAGLNPKYLKNVYEESLKNA